jgi:hypothetical protein
MPINPAFVLVIMIIISFSLLAYFLSPKSVTAQNIGPSPMFSIQSANAISHGGVSDLNSSRFTLSFFINPFQSNQQVTNAGVTNAYIPIIKSVGSWDIEFSGISDAASNDSSYMQLKVYENNYQSGTKSTAYPLVPLPFQKWTYVCIVRDSRRISIYYNGTTIFSQVLDLPLKTSGGLTMGNSASYVFGDFTNLQITPTALNVEDIKKNYEALSDINGLPYSASITSFPSLANLFTVNYGIRLPTFQASTPPPGTIWNIEYA